MRRECLRVHYEERVRKACGGQGHTLIHVRAKLEQLKDTFMD
jgi:hypothetical protein